MNYHPMNLCKLAGFMVAVLIMVGLADRTLVQAQSGPPAGMGPPPTNDPRSIDSQRQIRESGLRGAELNVATAKANYEKQIQAAIEHMREDFTRIQIVRNDIAHNLVSRKPLDYDLISQQTAEINKRSNRLNLYMRAHAPDEKEENNPGELKSEEMIGALVKLCKVIDSFTENPALKNAASVEVREIGKAKEDKAMADKDLLAIIKLSEAIQKKSASLKAAK
jgi:hypothetical protein